MNSSERFFVRADRNVGSGAVFGWIVIDLATDRVAFRAKSEADARAWACKQ